MVRKKKLKRRIKRLKRELRQHQKETKNEIKQLQILIEQQAVAHTQHIKKIHKDNMLWLNHYSQQLMCQKLDRTVLSSVLSKLAVEVSSSTSDNSLETESEKQADKDQSEH